MSEPRRIHVVAAVIVEPGTDADLRVLVCRRGRRTSSAGRWEFPGGKVESGEDASAALVREIREELGVDVTAGEALCRGVTRIGTGAEEVGIDLECRWAHLEGEAPTASTDHDRLEWMPRAELAGLDWCEPDLEAAALLAAGAEPRF